MDWFFPFYLFVSATRRRLQLIRSITCTPKKEYLRSPNGQTNFPYMTNTPKSSGKHRESPSTWRRLNTRHRIQRSGKLDECLRPFVDKCRMISRTANNALVSPMKSGKERPSARQFFLATKKNVSKALLIIWYAIQTKKRGRWGAAVGHWISGIFFNQRKVSFQESLWRKLVSVSLY